MAAQGSFWQRVGTLFRSDAAAANDDPAATAAPPAPAALQRLGDSGSLPWWKKRQARQAQSREVAIQVVELAGAMRRHFEHQDERAAALAGSLDRVGAILEQLAASQHAHGEYLRSIAQQTETAGKHAAQLGETLGRVPDALLTQAEAIRTVARQVEVAQETDAQLMHSLQHFGQAVGTLSNSATAQVEALQKLNAGHRDHHAALTGLVREQSKRFLIITVCASLLALVGLTALVVTVVLQLRP